MVQWMQRNSWNSYTLCIYNYIPNLPLTKSSSNRLSYSSIVYLNWSFGGRSNETSISIYSMLLHTFHTSAYFLLSNLEWILICFLQTFKYCANFWIILILLNNSSIICYSCMFLPDPWKMSFIITFFLPRYLHLHLHLHLDLSLFHKINTKPSI